MIEKLHRALQDAVRAAVKTRYGLDVDAVVLEKPPQSKLGDLATPLPFELAKQLKRAPRQIAVELAESVVKVEGVEKAEVAGAGYLNFHFARGAVFSGVVEAVSRPEPGVKPDAPKVIVEHTNINPN